MEGLSLDAVVGRWDVEGELVWAKTFGAGEGYVGLDAGVGEGGEVVAVGFGGGDVGGEPLGRSDAFVVAYAPDGERLWARRFGSSEFDVATAVVVAPDGVIYVTGHTWGRRSDLAIRFRAGEYWFLAAYDMDGERLWLHEYASDAAQPSGGWAE